MTDRSLTENLQADFARRKQLVDEIHELETKAEAARGAYLQATGWRYSSTNNPGSWWLWEKETVRGKVTAKTKDAVEQQRVIDLQDGVYEGDESDDE